MYDFSFCDLGGRARSVLERMPWPETRLPKPLPRHSIHDAASALDKFWIARDEHFVKGPGSTAVLVWDGPGSEIGGTDLTASALHSILWGREA